MNVLRVGGLFQTYESVIRATKLLEHRRQRSMYRELDLIGPVTGNLALKLSLARRNYAFYAATTRYAYDARQIDVTA